MKEKAFRIGKVVKKEESNLGCCHHTYVNCLMFEYVEVVYDDGTRKFYYDNDKEFEHFERNFVSKRFTSYHEFFTTEEEAIEDRGFMKLKYFVRRSDDSYEFTDLKVLKEELENKANAGNIEKVCDRITMYGEYDVTANDHWNEQCECECWA